MAPISEYFSSDKRNPLTQAGISPIEKIIYMMDMPFLCMAGAKIWIRERLELPELRKESQGIQWWWFDQGGGYPALCPEHRSIDLLRYVAETAEKRNIRVLFYIVPFQYNNYKRDPESFECSVRQLNDASTTRTTRCVNLAKLLSADQFINTLHYGASGHQDIAKALIPEIHKLLAETD